MFLSTVAIRMLLEISTGNAIVVFEEILRLVLQFKIVHHREEGTRAYI